MLCGAPADTSFTNHLKGPDPLCLPVPDMDLDASESDSLDIVLSSAAHSRSFAPTAHGSPNRNTGVHHPGHWRSESRPSCTQAQPSKRRRVGNSVMVCPSLNCLQQCDWLNSCSPPLVVLPWPAEPSLRIRLHLKGARSEGAACWLYESTSRTTTLQKKP